MLLSCVQLFCDPMDGSSPGSSVHGILQPRILEWVAISFFRVSSRPRDRTHIFYIGRRLLDTKLPGKPLLQTPAEAYLVLSRRVSTSPRLAHPQWCKHHEEKNHYLPYFLFISMKRKKESEVAQSCPTLGNSMDCKIPSSSVHGSFQARLLEWVAISFSRGSSWPRDRTWVSHIAGKHFTIWATREDISP